MAVGEFRLGNYDLTISKDVLVLQNEMSRTKLEFPAGSPGLRFQGFGDQIGFSVFKLLNRMGWRGGLPNHPTAPVVGERASAEQLARPSRSSAAPVDLEQQPGEREKERPLPKERSTAPTPIFEAPPAQVANERSTDSSPPSPSAIKPADAIPEKHSVPQPSVSEASPAPVAVERLTDSAVPGISEIKPAAPLPKEPSVPPSPISEAPQTPKITATDPLPKEPPVPQTPVSQASPEQIADSPPESVRPRPQESKPPEPPASTDKVAKADTPQKDTSPKKGEYFEITTTSGVHWTFTLPVDLSAREKKVITVMVKHNKLTLKSLKKYKARRPAMSALIDKLHQAGYPLIKEAGDAGTAGTIYELIPTTLEKLKGEQG